MVSGFRKNKNCWRIDAFTRFAEVSYLMPNTRQKKMLRATNFVTQFLSGCGRPDANLFQGTGARLVLQ